MEPKRFHEFPPDVKSEILKYSPTYKRISKEYYDSRLFYEQYCNLPITMNEFIKYISRHKPYPFIIFYTLKDQRTGNGVYIIDFYTAYFRDYYYDTYDYMNMRWKMNIINDDIDEQSINIEVIDDDFNIDVPVEEYLINQNNFFYENNYDIIKINFDIRTLRENYSKRYQCIEHHSQYVDNMLNKEIRTIKRYDAKSVKDLYDFFDYLCGYLYFLAQNESDKIDDIMVNLVDIKFKMNGEPYDTKLLEEYLENFHLI